MNKIQNRKKYDIGIYIFRRDLRINDNRGLIALARECNKIYACFIITPEQTRDNSYASSAALGFMFETLGDLATQIKELGGALFFYFGDNVECLRDMIAKTRAGAVGYSIDYSPYARSRDAAIRKLCAGAGVACIETYDYYLIPPEFLLNKTGTTYKKFTPYYMAALEYIKNNTLQSIKINDGTEIVFLGASAAAHTCHYIAFADARKAYGREFVRRRDDSIIGDWTTIKAPQFVGSRASALEALAACAKLTDKLYLHAHDDLTCATSRLSPYIKFGLISIREVYAGTRKNAELQRQLIWREFYAGIMWAYPYVIGRPMREELRKLRWRGTREQFALWAAGRTGFPIVDAGIREMLATGYMHNRARLIVASFLVKTLLIDWRAGEKFFAVHLVDYDISNNNGNWQWIAGTGADSQPYFRIFNPWRQTRDHDQHAIYIKKWVPELRKFNAEIILDWDAQYNKFNKGLRNEYPAPMVDYGAQCKKALAMYEAARK